MGVRLSSLMCQRHSARERFQIKYELRAERLWVRLVSTRSARFLLCQSYGGQDGGTGRPDRMARQADNNDATAVF